MKANVRLSRAGEESCEMCGAYHHQLLMESSEDGALYCPTCAGEMIFTCACCGGRDFLWNMTGYDDKGMYYCENCAVSV